jgi:hypothetical protein
MAHESNDTSEGRAPLPQSLGARLLLIVIGVAPFFAMPILRRVMPGVGGAVLLLAVISGVFALLWFFAPSLRRARGLPPETKAEVERRSLILQGLWRAEFDHMRQAKGAVIAIALFVSAYTVLLCLCVGLQFGGVDLQPTSPPGVLSLLAVSAAIAWFGPQLWNKGH